MKLHWRPQILAAMAIIALLTVPCYFFAPNLVDTIIVAGVVAESNLAMKLLEKE